MRTPFRLTALMLPIILTMGCSHQSNSTSEEKKSPIAMTKKYVLDNGLIVLISANRSLPIISYYTYYDVGGRYEGEGTTGATHFLEHMMFKGAKKYGPGEFESIIEHNGGSSNAYTTSDATVYYQNIPAHLLETMLNVESDRMQHLLLEPISFENERQVVFEERKMRYENSPDGQQYLTMMKKVFEGTPYGQSVIGEVEDLKKLSRDQMMTFFKTFYVPNNAIIGIVGDVDPEKTIELVKKYFGQIPSNPDLEKFKQGKDDKARFEFKSQTGVEYRYFSTNTLPKMSIAYRALKAGEKKTYATDLLSQMLSEGASSYLQKKYVSIENPKIANISASHYNLRYSGLFYLDVDFANPGGVDEVRDMLLNDSKKFCDESLTEKGLQKSKNVIQTQSYHSLKSNAAVASSILINEKYYGDFNYAQKEMKIYQETSLDEVKTVCRDIFNKQSPVIISLWNQFPKDKEEVIKLGKE